MSWSRVLSHHRKRTESVWDKARNRICLWPTAVSSFRSGVTPSPPESAGIRHGAARGRRSPWRDRRISTLEVRLYLKEYIIYTTREGAPVWVLESCQVVLDIYEVGLVFPLGHHRWLSFAFAEHSTKIQTSFSMPMVQTVYDSARTESDIHTKGPGEGRRKAICRQSFMEMAIWLKVS